VKAYDNKRISLENKFKKVSGDLSEDALQILNKLNEERNICIKSIKSNSLFNFMVIKKQC